MVANGSVATIKSCGTFPAPLHLSISREQWRLQEWSRAKTLRNQGISLPPHNDKLQIYAAKELRTKPKSPAISPSFPKSSPRWRNPRASIYWPIFCPWHRWKRIRSRAGRCSTSSTREAFKRSGARSAKQDCPRAARGDRQVRDRAARRGLRRLERRRRTPDHRQPPARARARLQIGRAHV